jgi:hypothetical protein
VTTESVVAEPQQTSAATYSEPVPAAPYGEPVPASPYGETAYESQSAPDSKTEAAKQEAAQVKDTATEAGRQVAGTAKEEAANVVAETKTQARSLLSQARDELSSQGSTQKDRLAGTLHGYAKELGAMASSSSESGPLTDLAHQASRKGGEIAHWLENSEPSDVLDEIKRFARRRPLAFLALCAAAGVLAGRLGRSAVAANTSLDSPDDDNQPGRAYTGSEGMFGPDALSSGYATGTGSGYGQSDPAYGSYAGDTGYATTAPGYGGTAAPGYPGTADAGYSASTEAGYAGASDPNYGETAGSQYGERTDLDDQTPQNPEQGYDQRGIQ